MYLDNPKFLYEDLLDVRTMYDYMIACKEDDMEDDLSNLISIVKHNHDELHRGGEGSLRWDLDEYTELEDKKQVIEDHNTMRSIWKELQKELHAKFVVQCESCHYAWFYSRNSKLIKELRENGRSSNSRCFCKGTLQVYSLEEWLVDENIYNDVSEYL